MNERTDILPGDLLEEEGQKRRKISLWLGVSVTLFTTLITGFLAGYFIPIPYLWIIAMAFVFTVTGPYGTEYTEPGYIKQLEWLGKKTKAYYGHGKSWIPKILGFKLAPVVVRMTIHKIPLITELDKDNAKVFFHNVRVKYQILRPYQFALNTTEENLRDEVDSKTKEAIREKTSKTTYERMKKMTSKGQESIKKNIEKKLEEEQDLGAGIVSLEWENVTADETIEQEDQELVAREKRMTQVEEHIERLAKDGVSRKEAIKEIKVFHKIVPEKIETIKKEQMIELGENARDLAKDIIVLISGSKKKEQKNDKSEKNAD